MPRTTAVISFIWSLLRHRAASVVLWLFIALWGFDLLVYFLTETQWFASVGQSALWWARCRAQGELFLAFALLGCLLTVAFLRPVAKLTATTLPLKGQLARFEALRNGAPRFARNLLVVLVTIVGWRLTRNWTDWLQLRHAAPTFSPTPFRYLSLPVTLWMQFLPVFVPFLKSLWLFSWGLFIASATTGVLRALPELAARNPQTPLVLNRVLWRLGAWLLLLRALMHGTGILDLPRGKPLETGDVFISLPIYLMGLLGCLVLAVAALRRAGSPPQRNRISHFVVTLAIVVWLPGIANWFLTPVRTILPEMAWLKRERHRATQIAWQLDFDEARPNSSDGSAAHLMDQAWPVWNERLVLESLSGPRFTQKVIVDWERVTITKGRQWQALVIGQAAGAKAWNSDLEASQSNELQLKRFGLEASDGKLNGDFVNNQHIYYGFPSRSLFSDEPIGLSIASIPNKLLWGWRTRDIFIPFEGANFSRLLVFRGAEERAQRVAPFLKITGDPQLILDGGAPVWVVDASATSHNFPGAMIAPAGRWDGANAVSDRTKVLVDGRTGAVSLFTTAPRETDPLQASWRAALPKSLQKATTLTSGLQQAWRAAPGLLETQFALYNKLRSGDPKYEKSTVLPAQLGLSSQSQPLQRAIAVLTGAFETLEVEQGLEGKRVFRHSEFDFAARRDALAKEIEKLTPNDGKSEGNGKIADDVFVWPDGSVPGGFCLGQGYFITPDPQNSHGSEESQTELWRVALTSAAPEGRINIGESLRAVALEMLGMVQGDPSQLPLAVQALRAHNAAQDAARNNKWELFGRESAKERRILEQMAAGAVSN